MAEIESKAIHIQVTPEEAIDSKKKLLEMDMHVLNVLQHFLNFKKLNREESKERQNVKRLINNVNEGIENILQKLPKKEEDAKPILKVKREKFVREREEKVEEKKSGKTRIERELEGIKERLERLS